MSYTPPSGTLDASWVGAPGYARPRQRLWATWYSDSAQRILPVALPAPGVLDPDVRLASQFVRPAGFESMQAGLVFAFDDHPSRYRPPQWSLDASWLGADVYAPPFAVLRVSWSVEVATIAPGGWSGLGVGAPSLYGTQVVQLGQGWDSLQMGVRNWALHDYEYAPPQWVLNASWVNADPYTPAKGILTAVWALPSEVRNIALTGWDSLVIGQVQLPVVRPEGFDSGIVPAPSVRNSAAQVRPGGWSNALWGQASIWNWRQYRAIPGFASQAFGAPSVLGGVKTVAPQGLLAYRSGSVAVINTTGEQTIVLRAQHAIAPPGLGAPAVSPRFLRPGGIYGTRFSEPMVQFPPRPLGWLSSAFGYPVVEYKTKVVAPAGLATYVTGAASIRDRATRVWHDSRLSVTSVFGDVQVALKNTKLAPAGFDAFATSPWAQVRSTRRFLEAASIEPPEVGSHSAWNATPQVFLEGIAPPSLGSADVGHRRRPIRPSGVPGPYPQVAKPSLWQTPGISPASLAPASIAAPTVWFRVRQNQMDGFDAQSLGAATVWFKWRRVLLQSHGPDTLTSGKPSVSHAVRAVAPRGSAFMALGGAWVSRGRRVVDLHEKGIEYPGMSNHRVGRTLHIAPLGFEATGWLRTILPERQDVYPKAITSPMGEAKIELLKRYLRPSGITTYPEAGMHWGNARAWNLRQLVFVEPKDEASGLHPVQGWSEWALIENRNKIIGAIGMDAARYGYTQVQLGARVVQARGIEAPALPVWQKTGMVSHRVRALPLEGVPSPAISKWGIVWNKADPVYPDGFVASAFGTASVETNRRFVRALGYESREQGFPMVAYRVREVGFDPRYTIAPPRIELPHVYLYQRYLEPAGMPEPQPSVLHILESKFNRITPQWTQQGDRFGHPALRNLTPELHTRGRASDEWGDALVRLQWRPVQPEGRSTQLFGLARIADRTQRIEVPGANYLRVSDKVTVRRTGTAPVVPQYIDLRRILDGDTELESGYGIDLPIVQVPAPDLLKGYVFHNKAYSGGNAQTFGRPTVTANTIRVEPGYWDFQFPNPVVSLKHRTIEVPTMGVLVQSSSDTGEYNMGSWGKPRLSPHTIYAVIEAPAQALRNHQKNPATLHPVNEGARLGRPSLSQYKGNIYPLSIGPTSPTGTWGVGRPRLIALRQYVSVNGFNAMRFGWSVIPGTQLIDVEDGIAPQEHGRGHQISRPAPPPQVRASGFSAMALGRPVVGFYNRSIRPSGWDSQRIDGRSGPATGNNMPQRLHVGPPNLHEQVGFDTALYGTAWVSHWVRGIEVSGHDAFVSEYDPQNFEQRMRVRVTPKPAPSIQSVVQTPSQPHTAFGTPGMRLAVHYIRPDGNSDQYRKGAPLS